MLSRNSRSVIFFLLPRIARLEAIWTSFALARSLSTKQMPPDQPLLGSFKHDDLVVKLNHCICDEPPDTRSIALENEFAVPKDLLPQHRRSLIQQDKVNPRVDRALQFNGIR